MGEASKRDEDGVDMDLVGEEEKEAMGWKARTEKEELDTAKTSARLASSFWSGIIIFLSICVRVTEQWMFSVKG